ncbi:hypothetical protein BB381_05700 [Campylobacter pinnipediorum subsp. caledonicus]|uniref:CmeU family protein n=1 Tax=Campylobacter pinnipediorum TaxID=1965231 RepID=UPI000994AF33|nr:CmeU family protein [Campylobacter pinnipediorum]AQW85791.1 hypothetical protein CPIN18020_0571 [Campylobacter pinnipediorum subsp. caledonicus]OPA72521.1 hypothetical protein BB381_05700 [Campylobacter pinnipediorum subsp. caledonicus]
MQKELVEQKIKDLFKARDDFFDLLDSVVPKKEGTDIFDFDKQKDVDLKDVYAKFYAYDYSIRKLLIDVYRAYEID